MKKSCTTWDVGKKTKQWDKLPTSTGAGSSIKLYHLLQSVATSNFELHPPYNDPTRIEGVSVYQA